MSLLGAARAARERERRRVQSPLDSFRWLPLQHEFLNDDSKRKQMRAGQQAQGKTTAGLAEGIYHSTGQHPFYPVPPPPTEGAIVCATAPQSLPIQQKLWDLLPKDELHPETQFVPGKGFVGRYPVVRWLNGSMTWILTAGQGGLGLAGRSLDWVHFDEPPKSPRIFGEVIKRLVRGNPGRAWLTYTPINAPVDYLQKMVKQSKIVDHWGRLTPTAMIPVGSTHPVRLGDGTICDQEWIDAQILDTMEHEIPVVIHGEWETKILGARFTAFRGAGSRSHIVDELSDLDLSTRIAIDYGSGAEFSAAASLLQAKTGGLVPKVWICDEAVSDESNTGTTIDEDATRIVTMLARNGLHWQDLDQAYGDRPWEGKKGLIRKDNALMMAALERAYEMDPHTLRPRLKTAKTGKNRGGAKSVAFGCRFLHRLMVRDGHFHVHRRCERGVVAVQRWNGRHDSEHKHILDTWRYGFDDLIFADVDKPRIAPVHVR